MVYTEPRDVPQPDPSNPSQQGNISPTDQAETAAAYKRAGKSKVELLKAFRQRIETSKRWRKEEGYDETWERLVQVYRNRMVDKSSNDQIVVNISFSTVNTIAPGVAVNYPTISVNPRRPEFEGPAQAVEGVVNYWFKHYDWRAETKRTVRDAIIIGHGWAKVWWKYAEATRPLTDQERSDLIGQQTAAAGDQAEQDPSQAHLLPNDEQIAADAPTTAPDVLADQPCVERVSPKDILVDPEATYEGDLGWIAQKIVRPLSEVKKDGSFTRAGRKAVKPDAGTNPRWRDDQDEASTTKSHNYADDIQRVTLWEFYDLRNRFYCVFAENGGGQFLLEPTDLPYGHHPFVYLGNYDVPDHFYDIGDLEVIEPLQYELNAVRSDLRNHRKHGQRKYMALRDKFDEAAEAALESERDGAIAWIEGDQLEGILAPMPVATINAELYQYSEQVENDIDLVSGVSEYQRGSQSEIRRTATEASMINDASNARSADKLSQVEVFLAEVAKRVVALAQKYITGDHAVQILGQDGAKQWIAFDNASIQGEFDFEVEAGSTQPQDENFKRQQALQLAQTLQPFVGTTIDPTALAMYVLKDGFGIKNPEQFMVQAPPDQGPSEKLIESISYKDVPPDIKAQMEKQAGFTPSAMWSDPQVAAQAALSQHGVDLNGDGQISPDEAAAAQQGGGESPDASQEGAPSDQQEQGAEAPGDPNALASGAAPQSGQNIDPAVLLQMQQQGGA